MSDNAENDFFFDKCLHIESFLVAGKILKYYRLQDLSAFIFEISYRDH